MPMETQPCIFTPMGYGQVTAATLNSAASSLPTVPQGARIALINAVTQAVSWRDDGTAPTATSGMQIAAGTTLQYTGQLGAFQAIAVTSGAVLNVSYYR